jgi:hypothetical protein
MPSPPTSPPVIGFPSGPIVLLPGGWLSPIVAEQPQTRRPIKAHAFLLHRGWAANSLGSLIDVLLGARLRRGFGPDDAVAIKVRLVY